MKVLCFSVIMVLLVSIMIIPNVFAPHDSDKQWGTIYVDSPVLEIPYTAFDDSEYQKIKIFGTVVEPRSSAYIYMTITEPDDRTYESKTRPNSSDGNYANYILICCNNVGKYSVSAEWKNNHVGTVTFDVIQKTETPSIITTTPSTESIIGVPAWIKSHAGWWAKGQINDSAYLVGIQYLIKENIILIPPTEMFESSGMQEVPAWIKNAAGWWSEGQIDDITYISGIQYLLKVGIIKIS